MNCTHLCTHHSISRNLATNQAQTPPASQAPTGSAEFSQNPQDKVVFEPSTYVVEGLKGGDIPQVEKAILNGPLLPENGKYVFDQGDARYHAANSFSAVARTIKFFEEGTGHSIAWSFGRPQLEVVPDGGEMLNAYYQPSNGNVNFFHSTDPVTNQVVYSGDSGEVVSHECGHAILDSMRPNYLYNWRSDVGAFHESFGDMLALLMSVQDDRTLAKVVEQTGGDMGKQNVAAALGEELGITINHTAGKDRTGGDYTRNAINSFTWKDPKTLPKNPENPNELGSEVHNFSRLWTGAFYDVFSGIVAENRAAGMEPAQAIREASNEGLRMLGRLLEKAPKVDFTYKKMAEVFVGTEREGGKHADLVAQCYKKREILPESFNVSDAPVPESVLRDDGPAQFERVALHGSLGNFSGASVEVVADPQRTRADIDDLQSTIKKHIENGSILYTDPHQVVTDKDLFDAKGNPYVGVLRWRDGEPVIERNRVVI